MEKSRPTPARVGASTRIQNYLLSSGIFFFLFSLFFSSAQADTTYTPPPEYGHQAAGNLHLPPSYGKVIYSYNEKSPKMLYIIGINHRDCQSRLNGTNTANTQVEIYRIGEWLNRSRKIDLLLPEGFFNSSHAGDGIHLLRQSTTDTSIVEKQLKDDSHFVNAEILLMEHLQLPACQVEDRGLYDAVLKRVVKLNNEADGSAADCQALRAEIKYLQEKRTATILQKIPDVIERNFQNGNINSENALFTIGLNHIDTIIKFIEQKSIALHPPPSTAPEKDDSVADLALLKQGFGVTVIIPSTLVNNQEAPKVAKLGAQY